MKNKGIDPSYLEDYYSVEEVSYKVGLNKLLLEILRLIKRDVLDKPRTTKKAIDVFDLWFRSDPNFLDIEFNQCSFCLLMLFKKRLLKKMKTYGRRNNANI
jgi:hypothetical protein